MRILGSITLITTALALTPAGAQEQDGHYRMAPTPDGFLKLDSRTGAVSECKRGRDGYQCTLVPDGQRALQAEIDRLAKENAELKEKLAKGEAPMPEAPRSGTKPEARGGSPSDEEIDRALGVMEKFLRRFLRILREESGKQN